jgi:hypothetical protein
MPFALTSETAQRQIKERAETFANELFKEAEQEAATFKRRVK